MKTISKYIYNQVANGQLVLNDAKTMLMELQDLASTSESEIAVIGMACRFPKAANPDEFWWNIINQVHCIDDFPGARSQDCLDLSSQSLIARFLGGNPFGTNGESIYVKGGYLNEIDKFDAAFFRITPKEAMFMDPLQRMFLETAYQALEDAGYGGQKLYGANVGVFVGKDHTNSTMYQYVTEPNEMQLTGSWAGILASRISYIYNFRGPSMVIDTACSSGLVALHEACRALNNQECEMAIAGGIHLQIFTNKKGAQSAMEMVESRDEHVRAFDKDASGTVWGEGVGALIVKSLPKAIADRDHIYAVIKGSAINNDGASNGITAPNAEAQRELLIQAWKAAKIEPETISYIEAHGTGTNLGDPIEIKGLTSAFEEFTTKKQFCGIGSVKTNVGHLVAAAGLASAIKVILALKHQEIPPSINFQSPNPYINFFNCPVYVNDHLRPWNTTDGTPRRGGVSAFGFSGTNCHVILEESPQVIPPVGAIHESPLRESPPNPGPHILTLSARNHNVLQELLKRYHDFLAQNTEADLGNICYTANTGRGHYNFRIALIVHDLKDLRQKIARLVETAPAKLQEAEIYYGTYKIVSDSKNEHGDDELTENERRELSSSAAQILREFVTIGAGTQRAPESEAKLAAELCRLYIKGADLLWDELYQDQSFRKVSLPVYPLERIKCWAPPNTTGIQGLQIDLNPIHPLLHMLLADSLDQKIYLTRFQVDQDWVLNEHRVLDYYIAPGTTYLEMARAAARAYYEDGPIEFRDFMFINPLAVEPGESKEVQTIVKKEPLYLDFTVASKTRNSFGEEEWVIHVQGKIYQFKPRERGRFDLAELKAKLNMAGNQIYTTPNHENKNFAFGPRWNNVVFGAGADNQALLQLKLPEEFAADLQEYEIHPALMDQAADAFSQSIEGMRLPLGYKKMTIYGRMPASFYCYMRRKDQGTGNLETILLDATLMDEAGEVFIEIEDYSLKKVKNEELKLPKAAGDTFYYGFTWLPAELTTNAPPTGNGSILIFKDGRGVADRIIQELQAEGKDLVEVEIGSDYQQVNPNHYFMKGEEADYQKVLKALSGKKIQQIIHLMSISQEANGEESILQLEAKLVRGVYSLFYLTKALAEYNFRDKLDLVLIADQVHKITGLEDRMNLAAAALLGLGKVVVSENEQLQCRAIDLDDETSPAQIAAEIRSPYSVYQVAYRRQQRFIQEFQKIDLPSQSDSEHPAEGLIRPGGVYIITGGTGGIGLEIGKLLAAKAPVKLALINRNPMPGREFWDELVASNNDQKLSAKIAAIRAMEQAGSEVLLFGADIADEGSLQPVLVELRQKYGRINGIIHAAGIVAGGTMIRKDIETFQKVVAPKIQGTWLLDKLTADDQLDFFILCSSLSTLIPGMGESDYTAANAYLDAFAAYRNQPGKRTLSINWPLWEGVGLGAYGITDQNLIFKAVSRTKALAIFEEILAAMAGQAEFSRVIFGELNYQMLAAFGTLPFQLSEQLSTAIRKQTARLAFTKASPKGRTFQKAAVIGINSQDEEQTVYIMAQIWAGVFGLAEIDVHQNLYDLGGDSILASQLFREIDRDYPGILSISDIYTYPSVSQLANYIDSNGGLPSIRKPRDTTPESSTLTTAPEKSVAQTVAEKSSKPAGSAGDGQVDFTPTKLNLFYDLTDLQPFEIDEAQTKVLWIKAQNEITSYLCHALPLCAVLANPKMLPWYYEHFIEIFSIEDENGGLKVDFLEYRAAYKELMHEVYMGYNLLKKESNIIEFVIDKINQGYYVIIHVDEYYLPVKIWYQKVHYTHHSIVYGYDNRTKTFLAMGFNMNHVFTPLTFDYDTFAFAYEEGKLYYKESAPWAENNAVELLKFKDFKEEYPFDIKRFMLKLEGYLTARRDDPIIYSFNWKLNQDKITYGFDVYQQVINHLEYFLDNRFTLDYRAIHMLYDHKKSIYNRLKFVLERYRITGPLEKMVQEYYGIVEDIEPVRRKFMEQNYSLFSHKFDFERFAKVIQESLALISSIKEKDEKLLTAIYEQLQRQFKSESGK